MFKMLKICIIFAVIGGNFYSANIVAGERYMIGGRIFCLLLDQLGPPQTQGGVSVQVWDSDANILGIDPDDLLGETETNWDGNFSLVVEESELFGPPNLYLQMRHRCHSDLIPRAACHLVTRFPLQMDNPAQLSNLTIYLGTLYEREHLANWARNSWEEC